MKTLIPASAAILLLCLPLELAADPPKVVRSEPADGAAGVAVGVGAVRVWFDRNMNQDTWTFGASDRGQFPPMDGPNDAPWRDPRCVELKIKQLRANYEAAGVQAELTPFIDDTASAFAQADIIVCRAGASTVTEIAAVGAAAVFVPFPAAVDDHQTTNAQFLVQAGGGWLVQQRDLSPQMLAQMLQNTERTALVDKALKAKNMQKIHATREVVTACEELAA